MTDRNDDDPLLVRPYLLGQPGGTAPPPSGPTWPEAAPAPAPPADPTVVLPVTTAPPRRRSTRRLVLVLASILALVLLGTAAAVSALLPGTDMSSAGPVDAPLPAPATPSPETTGPPEQAGAVPAAPEPAPARTSSSPATAPSSSPSPSAATSAPAGRSAAPTRTVSSPPVPLLLPPPDGRAGRIHGPGGLCLDLNGGLAVDSNHVQVFTCNDTTAQVWTLAADGTLRVVGKCAVAADDGAVRIAGCDSRRAAQWRAGPDRTLVNLAGGDCLTDPGTGTRSGAGVRMEDCSAAERQRWELP